MSEGIIAKCVTGLHYRGMDTHTDVKKEYLFITDGDMSKDSVICLSDYIKQLSEGEPIAYEHLPALLNYLHENKDADEELSPLRKELLDSLLRVYLHSSKGDWKNYINSRLAIQNVNKLKGMEWGEAMSATDLLQTYFLVVQAKHVLGGWGWQEVISIKRFDIQCSIPLIDNYRVSIDWLIGLRVFEDEFSFTEIESALVHLETDLKALLEADIPIEGGVDGSIMQPLLDAYCS